MRCRHCYSDIREATVTGPANVFTTEQIVITSLWLNAENRSPFCARSLCESPSHPRVWHEIKHEPMPAI